MKKNATKHILGFLTLLIVAAAGYWAVTAVNFSATSTSNSNGKKAFNNLPEQKELSKIKSKKARNDYFFQLLRDPATNSIPENIRERELQHARTMPTKDQLILKKGANNGVTTSGLDDFTWRLAGPPAVGGRTRALGIDQRNSDIIIAGGVSGGIWKSTDGGDNWTLRTPSIESFSVTSLTQDPTNPDTWYYVSGEFLGNSASSREISPAPAFYYGTGIYRSTNNGDTWSRIPGTEDDNTQFDSQFDYVNRVVASPSTGTVFVASNGFGIFRSPDGNSYNNLTLGGPGEHAFADVAVGTNGTVVAVLSSASAGAAGGNPGIYVSTNDGQTWNDVTPSSFPSDHLRSVLTTSPSNPDIVYIFTQKNTEVDDSNQGVSFYMLDLSGNPANASDRAANLPDFGDPVGDVDTQGGYNMTVAVKPNDPNVVTVGGINLFRSTDGFATAPTGDTPDQRDEFWIGGYAKANNVSQYPNQHPDQHVQIYDPFNPDRLWVGHDGGLSVTNDVEATDVSWIDRNDGYIVTQFYDASIGLDADDTRFMGGTQDNGTPFFEFRDEQDIGDAAADISSGDGGFSFFSENFIFVSNQQGGSGNNRVIRFDSDGNNFAIVQPAQSQTAFFINPYTIDPNDDSIMYYPGGSSLFRNTEIDQITNQSGGATRGWEELNAAATPGRAISALAVTTIPSNTLYYAASIGDQTPVILRLDNASSSDQAPVDISIPNAPSGAFVHDLAINPTNGNEVLAVMSNYNIVGLYHTTDGGNSWQAVEGNLTGTNDPTSPNAGPSLRSATIVPAATGPIYILGTSTGVYATETLDGNNTEWGRQSPFDNDGNDDIGFSVVENITSRFSDGDVAVGTHGRGMFVGRFGGEIADADIPLISLNPAEGRAGMEVTITATNFQFSPDISREDVLFGDVPVANIVDVTPSQLTVVVPRNTLDPTEDNRSVLVTVDRESGADPNPVSFDILPPGENDLGQNFPNPFTTSDGTTIPISLQNNSNVTLVIYDTSGRRIDTPLDDDPFQAGTYNIPVNFNNYSSGIYIYRIIADPNNENRETFVDSRKFTFIR